MVSGIWLPVVTPFKDGQVDVDALQRLAERYLSQEINGFVALGTTGEAALLDHSERHKVLRSLFEVIGTRLTVVVGVGGMNTRDMVQEIRELERWDIGGYLVSAPAYICPDQNGIRWHFDEVANVTERPIILYDVPHRTGVSIETSTVERLVERANIVAIKACVPATFQKLGQLPISLLCGNDDAYLDCLIAGGSGGILTSAHLFADVLAEIHERVLSERTDDAVAFFEALKPVIKLLFSAPNPAGVKAALALDGLIGSETRLPIMEASVTLKEQLRIALDACTRQLAVMA
ncbi:4-hydroxy-tetrahydrodipicolinate synthase [Caballeronia udeis]|uniref:4-hydroxy-tetrahydrodipicolinate synthase n=1 Tax=Caballeronia udeis TaxID=1232866 RepID=A0ABW8MQJ8_9BURK